MVYDKTPKFTDAELTAVDAETVKVMANSLSHFDYIDWKLHHIKTAKRDMMKNRTMSEMYELGLVELFTARDKAEQWLKKYQKEIDNEN